MGNYEWIYRSTIRDESKRNSRNMSSSAKFELKQMEIDGKMDSSLDKLTGHMNSMTARYTLQGDEEYLEGNERPLYHYRGTPAVLGAQAPQEEEYCAQLSA